MADKGQSEAFAESEFTSYNMLPTPVWVSDSEGNCLYVNDAWQAHTGQNLVDALGEGWLKKVSSEDIKKFKKIIQGCLLEEDNCEFRLKNSDNEPAWFLCRVQKTGFGFVGVAIDISIKIEHQKEVEQKNIEAKKFLRRVLESIPDPIFVKDKQHRWIEGNKAFFDMFGMPKEEVLGKSDYDFFGKEEADVFWEKDNEVFRTEQVVDNFETFTQKGLTRTFFTRKVAVNDSNGKKILIGAIRDVTDLEKIRQELARSNEELERFAYIASHDLQEPLRMLKNFTKLLNEKYRNKLEGDAVGYIDFAVDAAQRMSEMVDDLLDYARLNEQSTYKHDIDCTDILKYVQENLSESIRVSKAEIICKTKLPILNKANPVRLTRLFQNIISNSIKYRRPKIPPKIEISCEETPDFWIFSIADNGIGIAQKHFERIFYPFKRLHSREEYSGSGIGLSACKKIVENFGGKISVQSKEGEGSVFTFTYPKFIDWRND